MARFAGLLVSFAAVLAGQAACAQDLAASNGQHIYDAACSSCHYRGDGRAPFGTRSPQTDAAPDDLVRVILYGRSPKEGNIGMPGFAPSLTDADLTELVTYLRAQLRPTTPWSDLQTSITTLRKTGSRED